MGHPNKILNELKQLLKALTGQEWGVIIKFKYTFEVFSMSIMEYAAALTTYADPKLLHKYTFIELRSIKIVFRDP